MQLAKKKPLNYIFNLPKVGLSGGYETVNKQAFHLSTTLPFRIKSGPSTRRLIDLKDTKTSLGINPSGQCGYFFDDHYKDQFELYRKGEYRKQIMDMNLVKKGEHSTLALKSK